MFISRVLYSFLVIVAAALLTSCGGGGSSNVAPLAENKTITLWNTETFSIPFSGSDTDGDNLSFRIVTQPSQGTISGKTYIPDTNSRGEDQLVYVANDGKADSPPATIKLQIKAPFITTWKTDNLSFGSTGDRSIKIGTNSSRNTYNYSIDWGDGSKDNNVTDAIIHTYDSAGTYTVKISGEFPHIFFKYNDDAPLSASSDQSKILSVEQWGDVEWKSMEHAFANCDNLRFYSVDTPNLNQVKSLKLMLSGTKINQDISHWDVSSVTDMSYMFSLAFFFNQDISRWDVSNVIDMNDMFSSTLSFNQDLSTWDVSNVTNMRSMFENSIFNRGIGSWDVSKVTDMSRMFTGSPFNQDISQWDVSNVTNMSYMFTLGTYFNQDLGSWDVSNVKSMVQMFDGATLSSTHYDAILIGWSQRTLQREIEFSGGNSKYSVLSKDARDILINNYNWDIMDGGSE